MKKAVHKITTVRDGYNQQVAIEAAANNVAEVAAQQAAEDDRHTRTFLKANPHVGMLVRAGKPIFYVTKASGEYIEGSMGALTALTAGTAKPVILPPYWHHALGYEQRVAQLEAEDMTTSDAQGCADAEVMQGKHHGWTF